MSQISEAVVATIRTPWPPSVNHYWASSGSKRYLSAAARSYRDAVWVAVRAAGFPRFGQRPVEVRVVAYPPDNRRRDIDNLLKAVLDALAHAKVYADDSQIYTLRIERGPVVDGGALEVEVKEKQI